MSVVSRGVLFTVSLEGTYQIVTITQEAHQLSSNVDFVLCSSNLNER
jgi:hypothetical protein